LGSDNTVADKSDSLFIICDSSRIGIVRKVKQPHYKPRQALRVRLPDFKTVGT